MERLDRLRSRIDGTEDMESVVSTMKALAVVNMRQYERAAEAVDAYTETIELALRASLDPETAAEAERAELERSRSRGGGTGRIVVGSAHGMCGQFNEQLAAFVGSEAAAPRDEGPLLALGGRIVAAIQGEDFPVSQIIPISDSLADITGIMIQLLEVVERWRSEGTAVRVDLYYNRPKGQSSYQPVRQRVLPLGAGRLRTLARQGWPSPVEPLLMRPRSEMAGTLLRQHLFARLYAAFVLSLASENAARLAAMQAAESNIQERLEELRSRYNRRRQEEITMELMDIVAGAVSSGSLE